MQQQSLAKLNLFLHVTGKRASGYHDLQSLFVFAQDIHDIISITPANDFSLNVEGEFAGLIPQQLNTNILGHVVQLLHKPSLQAYHIHLTKNIPVGAGLGGGSGNAACLARMLNEAWQLGYKTADLAAKCNPIGADIAACFHKKPLWIEGTGDVMSPIAVDIPYYVVIIYPHQLVNTGQVFTAITNYSKKVEQPKEITLPWLLDARNDLEVAAQQIAPEITQCLAALQQQKPLLARMTGSGSACIGLFDSHVKAAEVQAVLAQKHPKWWVKTTEISKN